MNYSKKEEREQPRPYTDNHLTNDEVLHHLANKLEAEMQRLWDNGTLDQEKLDQLRKSPN